MRILVVSPVLPHLPSRDAARLAPSHLVEHLSERHAVGVVAATANASTPAARAWLAALAPLARVAAASVLACPESAVLRARDAARHPGPPWRRVRARLDERVETGWEREWFAAVAACVTGSEDDRRAIAAHLPSPSATRHSTHGSRR